MELSASNFIHNLLLINYLSIFFRFPHSKLIKYRFVFSQVQLFLHCFIIHSTKGKYSKPKRRSHQINILSNVPGFKQAQFVSQIAVFFYGSFSPQ